MAREFRWSVVFAVLSALAAIAPAAHGAPSGLCPGTCAGGRTSCGADADCADGERCGFEDACLPGLAPLIAAVLPEGPGGLNAAEVGWTCGLVDCVARGGAELSFHSDYGAAAVATKDVALEGGKRFLVMAEMRADPATWAYFDLYAGEVLGASEAVIGEAWRRVTAFLTAPPDSEAPIQFRLHADGEGFAAIRRIVVLELRDYAVYVRLRLLAPERAARWVAGPILRHREGGLDLDPRPCEGDEEDAGCIDAALSSVAIEAGRASAWLDASRMFPDAVRAVDGARVTIGWRLEEASGRAIGEGRVRFEVAYAPADDAIVWTGERDLAGDRVALVIPEGVPSPLALQATPGLLAEAAARDRAALARPASMRPEAFKIGARVDPIDLFERAPVAPATAGEGLRLLSELGLNAAAYLSTVVSETERALAVQLGLENRIVSMKPLLGPTVHDRIDYEPSAIEALVRARLDDPYLARELAGATEVTHLLVLGDALAGLDLAGPSYRQAYRAWLAAAGIDAAELGLVSLDEAMPLEGMSPERVGELRPDPTSDSPAARRWFHALRFWNEATAAAWATARRLANERHGSLPVVYDVGSPLMARTPELHRGVELQAMMRAGAVTGFLGDAFVADQRDACGAWQLGAYADWAAGVTAPWREAAAARGARYVLASRLHAARGDSGDKLLELAARGFEWFEHDTWGPHDASTDPDAAGGLGEGSRAWLEHVRDGGELLVRAERWLHGATRRPADIVMLASQYDAIWTDRAGIDGEELGWHMALTQAHFPVDFMLEDEIAQGLLSNPLVERRVLIVMRKHVARAAWRAIETWVEDGGTLILGGDFATHDELGAYDAARVEWQRFFSDDDSETTATGADTIRWATSRGGSSFAYQGPRRELVSVAGTPIALDDADRVVALRIPRGRGRIYALGLALGQRYRAPEATCDSARPVALARHPVGFSPVMREVMSDLVRGAGSVAPSGTGTELVALHRLDGAGGRPLVLAIPYANGPLSLALTIPEARRCTFIREELEGVDLPLTFGTVLTSLDGPAIFTWRNEDCAPPREDVVEASPEVAEPPPTARDEGCAGGGAAPLSWLLGAGLAALGAARRHRSDANRSRRFTSRRPFHMVPPLSDTGGAMSRPPSRRRQPAWAALTVLRACAIALATLALAGCGEEASNFSQVDTPAVLGDLCPPDLQACDEEGATRCDGDAVTTCREVTSGCLGWSAAQACPPNQACRESACAVTCPDAACDVPEARRCSPLDAQIIERCADGDGDGCLEWVATDAACAQPEVCDLGACAGACSDECAQGDRRCEAGAVVTCADHDTDGCREWGARAPCDAACSLGVCVESCRDECATVGLTRCDGPAVEVCERRGDGCLGWGAPTICPAGTSCSFGACAAACSDECVAGARTCDAGGVVTCGEHDGDDCADRGLPAACPEGETCSAGVCGSGCNNECTAEGARSCDAVGRAVRECRQGDADACLEWVLVATCDAGESCSNGACGAECHDECEANAARCVAGSATLFEVCADGDADPCREWVAGGDCADAGQVCAGGSCAAGCSDECTAALCDGAAVVACAELDGDECLDRGTPRACDAGETCIEGECRVAPPPSGVKIAEVLYQSEGPDDDTFIEIGGPPGMSLVGLALVSVNGANGSEGARLALSGSLDSAGRFVIAHPDAIPAILDWADMKSAFADLQNGPDNLLLVWGETTIDALGYGEFPPGAVFAGEGYPAPAADNGTSLSRIGALQDTDDNAADFALTPVPTPGRGYEPPARPHAEGDLVITELMIDPQARPDSEGEWIELYNPRDVTWDLAGCLLESDPGEVHPIHASLLIAPRQRVVWARSATPGFEPTYVYGAVTLANDGDALALICDGDYIDLVAWDASTPGRSSSLDPTATDAELNDDAAAWCPAPVEAASGADAGTPGAPNPPCPDQMGTYTAVALDSEWGACDASSDWQYIHFGGAPDARGDATLDFEWWSVLCELFTSQTTIEIQLRAGQSWTPIGGAAFSVQDESCRWHAEQLAVPEAAIDAARDAQGRIEARFRTFIGCPLGVGCGVLGVTLPASCARRFELTYPY